MKIKKTLLQENSTLARKKWPSQMGPVFLQALRSLTERHKFSISSGDLILLENHWYVTHTGLIRLARRSRCVGIHAEAAHLLSDPASSRWAFKATVYRSQTCKGFVGYGDADPSNVSPLVHGAEMRVAETRAVNRALRKAYGMDNFFTSGLTMSHAALVACAAIYDTPEDCANEVSYIHKRGLSRGGN